mmetsp:Transcript_97973/g.282623  ORF Transcript_97973/g.282623 Transcript_97973/m.282623 type:complete len:257 (+) Transcript_97973:1296-2066(+)
MEARVYGFPADELFRWMGRVQCLARGHRRAHRLHLRPRRAVWLHPERARHSHRHHLRCDGHLHARPLRIAIRSKRGPHSGRLDCQRHWQQFSKRLPRPWGALDDRSSVLEVGWQNGGMVAAISGSRRLHARRRGFCRGVEELGLQRAHILHHLLCRAHAPSLAKGLARRRAWRSHLSQGQHVRIIPRLVVGLGGARQLASPPVGRCRSWRRELPRAGRGMRDLGVQRRICCLPDEVVPPGASRGTSRDRASGTRVG